jgi:hypothetical protein
MIKKLIIIRNREVWLTRFKGPLFVERLKTKA